MGWQRNFEKNSQEKKHSSSAAAAAVQAQLQPRPVQKNIKSGISLAQRHLAAELRLKRQDSLANASRQQRLTPSPPQAVIRKGQKPNDATELQDTGAVAKEEGVQRQVSLVNASHQR